jgi:hypothetical protein
MTIGGHETPRTMLYPDFDRGRLKPVKILGKQICHEVGVRGKV